MLLINKLKIVIAGDLLWYKRNKTVQDVFLKEITHHPIVSNGTPRMIADGFLFATFKFGVIGATL